MKLVSLNIWGGIVFEPLLEFIDRHSSDTDIFCFQEVLFSEETKTLPDTKAHLNIFVELKKKLSDFSVFTRPTESKYFQFELLGEAEMGEAIFVRKSLSVKESGGFLTYSGEVEGMTLGAKATGNFQWVKIDNLVIGSIHGIWQRDTGKNDTPARIAQSQSLVDFSTKINGMKIFCGDFNLDLNTKSISMLEAGMRNLIKENKVLSTRSSLYSKGDSKFADYVFVSPGIIVNDFRVLEDVVSDHLPLQLDFSL